MSYLSIFAVSFTIALSGALSPGPLLTFVIAGSLKYGGRTGPVVIAGHAVLEILMVAALTLGIGKLINKPIIISAVSITGALILLYSGIALLRSIPEFSFDGVITETRYSSTLFLQGITMSIANPYWTVWWLTIGLGLLLSSSEKGLIGLSFFFTGHILADIIWYSFVSYSISKSKKFLSLKVYKRILGICASIIILFGIYFGISTFKKF